MLHFLLFLPPKCITLLLTGIIAFHSIHDNSLSWDHYCSRIQRLQNAVNKSSTFKSQITKLSGLMYLYRHTVQNLLKCGNRHPPLQTKRNDKNAKNTTFH